MKSTVRIATALLALAPLAPLAPLAGAQVCNVATDLEVAVSPLLALPGQTVTVTITNTSAACSYTLPTPCIFSSVHSEACDQDPLLSIACAGPIVPLGPGASAQSTWDQKDDLGNPLGDGLYVFNIPVLGPTGALIQLCEPVQLGFSCVKPFHYGAGDPGAGGKTPAISSVGGYPSIGNFGFQVYLTNAVGGGFAVCVGSAAQASLDLGFGTILVDPTQVLVSGVSVLSGTPGAPGQGIGFLPAPIPVNPALAGFEVDWQWVVVDAAASGGLALSEGLRIAVCL